MRVALLATWLLLASGCLKDGTYRWVAYRIDEGFEVDLSLYPADLTVAGPDRQISEAKAIAKRLTLEDLKQKGFAVETAEAISFSGARGGAIIGVVAGSSEFVKRAQEMGDTFWAYADLQHKKPIASGNGQLPQWAQRG